MKYFFISKKFVAKTGFEPASPRLQTGPLQKPISVLRVISIFGGPTGTRTRV